MYFILFQYLQYFHILKMLQNKKFFQWLKNACYSVELPSEVYITDLFFDAFQTDSSNWATIYELAPKILTVSDSWYRLPLVYKALNQPFEDMSQ